MIFCLLAYFDDACPHISSFWLWLLQYHATQGQMISDSCELDPPRIPTRAQAKTNPVVVFSTRDGNSPITCCSISRNVGHCSETRTRPKAKQSWFRFFEMSHFIEIFQIINGFSRNFQRKMRTSFRSFLTRFDILKSHFLTYLLLLFRHDKGTFIFV